MTTTRQMVALPGREPDDLVEVELTVNETLLIKRMVYKLRHQDRTTLGAGSIVLRRV